jgi:anti-sigma28 factor (negative regulator of flagellin synthesis)
VAEIKKSMEAGTYNIPLADVAERMTERLFA